MRTHRYIFDPLYGRIQLPDYVWRIAGTPEVQRLREVRLCNINSLSLTGGANINRYEHVIGTTHLAQVCAESWLSPLSLDSEKDLALAGLLHDIGSAAFGHSMQYLLDEEGFEHESVGDIITKRGPRSSSKYTYTPVHTKPIYFGALPQLPRLLSSPRLRRIGDIVAGNGPLGPIMNGSMDLDNIDNIFRLAYHIGLLHHSEFDIPLRLAKALSSDDDGLILNGDESLVSKWYEVRQRLYTYLLLNPEEFSAKCMLTEALEITIQEKASHFLEWSMVDFELLEALADASEEVNGIVSRLMVGKLYGCIAIVSVKAPCGRWEDRRADNSDIEHELQERFRHTSEHRLRHCEVRLHSIRDLAKTQRAITFRRPSGYERTVGENSDRALIGVFVKNTDLSSDSLSDELVHKNGLQEETLRVIRGAAQSEEVSLVDLYGEANTVSNHPTTPE